MKVDRTSECLEIVISGLKPRPKGRHRFANAKTRNGRYIKGHAYTPAPTRSYEQELRWHFRMACKEPWKGPVSVEMYLHTSSRADSDNLGKAILDAGNKILYLDDSQAVRTLTEKIKSSNEEIRILMQRIEE